MLAAKEFGYTWKEFLELEGREQSWIVAAFRTIKQLEAVEAYHRNQEMKKSRPRGK